MVSPLVSIYSGSPQLGNTIKTNSWNFKLLVQRYAEFWSFRKGSRAIFFSPHFMYDFWRKIFLLSYNANWPYLIGNPLLRGVSCNICIVIVYFPVSNVINICNVIKPFFCMTTKSEQKLEFIKSNRSFYVELKRIFYYC